MILVVNNGESYGDNTFYFYDLEEIDQHDAVYLFEKLKRDRSYKVAMVDNITWWNQECKKSFKDYILCPYNLEQFYNIDVSKLGKNVLKTIKEKLENAIPYYKSNLVGLDRNYHMSKFKIYEELCESLELVKKHLKSGKYRNLPLKFKR